MPPRRVKPKDVREKEVDEFIYSLDIDTPTNVPDSPTGISDSPLYEEEEESPISPDNPITPLSVIGSDGDDDIAPLSPEEREITSVQSPPISYKDLKNVTGNDAVNKKLARYRFTCLKYIVDEKISTALYAVCINYKGQIVFVELNNSSIAAVRGADTISVEETSVCNISHALTGSIKDRIGGNIYGVAVSARNNYCIMSICDDGTVLSYNYKVTSSETVSTHIPNSYAVVRYSDIEANHKICNRNIDKTYNVIHGLHEVIYLDTRAKLIKETNDVKEGISTFVKSQKSMNSLLKSEWERLKGAAPDYNLLFSKMSDEEEKKFEKIRFNMFLRFQAFVRTIELSDSLLSSVSKLADIKEDIKRKTQEINDIKEMVRGKVLTQAPCNVIF